MDKSGTDARTHGHTDVRTHGHTDARTKRRLYAPPKFFGEHKKKNALNLSSAELALRLVKIKKLPALSSDLLRNKSGPSCSKLTMSLVNDSLKFTSSDTQIF